MKRVLVVVSSLLLWVACGSPPPSDGRTASGTIGPEGGTLTSTDGRMTLSIPPDLVPTPTTFSIRLSDAAGFPNAGELLSPVYELGPDGHAFAGYVHLATTGNLMPPTDEVAVLAGFDPATSAWVPLVGSHTVGDGASAAVIGSTPHFSAYTTFHTAIFDRACPASSGSAGINAAGSVNLTGATLVRRYGAPVEYGSDWVANSPTVTVTADALLDGHGQYAPIPVDFMPGRTVLSPVGFTIVGRRISFTIDVRALTLAGFNAISIDEHCPGNYDVAFTCGPGCMGTAGDAGMTMGDAGHAPIACQVGHATLSGAARDWLAVAGSTLVAADSESTTDAVHTWDLSTPTTPVLRDSLSLTTVAPRQIAVRGTTAFVTDGASLVAIDISNSANITEVGRYSTLADTGLHTALGTAPAALAIGGVAIAGDRAYLSTEHHGFVVLDVSAPATMTRVGVSAAGSSAPGHVALDGNHAYFVSHMGGAAPDVFGVVIMDITNPSAPTRAGGYPIVGGLPSSLTVAGGFLYLGALNAQYFVVDVTNPAAPVLTTSIETNQDVHSLAVFGGKLYVASNPNDAHLQVYSLANPAMPVRLTDEGIAPSGGAWGVAIGTAHAYVSNPGSITAIDLACP